MIHLIAPEFTSPEEHLACDEALLDLAEERPHPGFLRFFEAEQYFVVLGYGKKLAEEVFEEACEARGIPILRRCSGGGTVLQGPGCLNFSLVLPIDAPGFESISSANRFIMQRHRDALAEVLEGEICVQGVSDLTLGGQKFSGNAQRRKKRCLLYHGSFLLNFNIHLIGEVLKMPSQQPDYRAGRAHHKFLTNIGLHKDAVVFALAHAWNARNTDAFQIALSPMVERLVREKYSTAEWNRRF